MRFQLESTSQPLRRRSARGIYQRALAAWFRLLRQPISMLYNLARAHAEWPGHSAFWANLEEYATWLPHNVRWKPDPLNGAIDIVPSRRVVAAQFQHQGRLEDDCDGLAYFSAQNVQRLVENPDRVFVVTMILDPFSFDKGRLLYAAHVICVFEHDDAWRVISNDTLYPTRFGSFAEAVQHNPYCAAHPVLWADVRDPELRRIASGRDLARVEQALLRKRPPIRWHSGGKSISRGGEGGEEARVRG